MSATKIKLSKSYFLIAFVFLVVAAINFFIVSYFILGKTEIIITPTSQKVSANILVDIEESEFDSPAKDQNIVEGKIASITLEETQTNSSTGSKEISDETVGQVKIINNYSKDQKLVATTRLLSPQGILLRLKNEVNVPASGNIIASVYPDKPEDFTELEPMRFTIPGLWSGLQDKIYAENETTLKKGGQKVKIVAADDLTTAEKKIVETLSEKALNDFVQKLGDKQSHYSKLVQKEILDKKADAGAGDEKPQFNLYMKIKIVIIAFDETSLNAIIKQKLSESLSEGMKLSDIDAKSVNYTVEKYDAEEKTANLKVYAEGKAALKGEGIILNKKALTGLSEPEIIQYFLTFPQIDKVEVVFHPAWLKRASLVAQRIKFIVQ